MPARRRSYRRKRNYRKRKRSTKPLQVARRNRVNYPLMPRTRLCKLRYTTRIQIDPVQVKAGVSETAANIATYTFRLNNLNDVDYTATALTGLSRDGAPNHQPRMYDQWATFYEYATVVGAKVSATFTTRQQAHLINTNHGAGDSAVTAIPVVKSPEPCIIGFLKREFEQNHSPNVRLDDILEKNHAVYKRTTHHPRSYTMVKKWSLKKDPMYKTELTQSTASGSDVSWGSAFNSSLSANNIRYLHFFAHPLTIKDDINPAPIDVMIAMDFIVLMSDLKDIAQS